LEAISASLGLVCRAWRKLFSFAATMRQNKYELICFTYMHSPESNNDKGPYERSVTSGPGVWARREGVNIMIMITRKGAQKNNNY